MHKTVIYDITFSPLVQQDFMALFFFACGINMGVWVSHLTVDIFAICDIYYTITSVACFVALLDATPLTFIARLLMPFNKALFFAFFIFFVNMSAA